MINELPLFFSFKFLVVSAGITLCFPGTIINSAAQQAPVIEWQNTIGGNSDDQLRSIQQTNDGGYLLGGYSNSGISGDKTESSIGGRDFWVVKTDSLGGIQWQNTIGGDVVDELLSVQQTADGGYILGGWSESGISGDKTENSNGGQDCWIVKTDSSGTIQWQNTIGGNDYDQLISIQQTPDGGYILGGNSISTISGDKTEDCMGGTDYWIVKTDNSGIIQWQNTIGGDDADILFCMQRTSDGGYILGGSSASNISGDKTENSNGIEDYWIVKIDSLGFVEWQNTIGGNDHDNLYSIQQTSDGGYILGGFSYSNISGDKTENSNGEDDYWIVKTDSLGNLEWQNNIGGNDFDEFGSIQQTTDGGYILGGTSLSDSSGDKSENCLTSWDYWVVKTDSSGTIQWQNTIGGNGSDRFSAIWETGTNEYIIGGYSLSDISSDKTENSNGYMDYWIMKLSPGSKTGIYEADEMATWIKVFPNPVTDKLFISGLPAADGTVVSICSMIGSVQQLSPNRNIVTGVDVGALSRGVYWISIVNDRKIFRAKFVKSGGK